MRIQLPENSHHVELECPRCGRHSIVQHGSAYICLNCGFRRDVTEGTSSHLGDWLWLIVGVVLLLALFPIDSTQPVPRPNPPSVGQSFIPNEGVPNQSL